MAETLSVQEMLPNKFEPKRVFRWIFAIEGIDSFLMKTAARPSMVVESLEIPFINAKRYIAGRLTFNTMDITHQETVSGRSGYADFYKRDCQIKLLDPVGTVVELWDMKGAQITSVDYQSLTYEDESAPMTIAMTLRYDNCVLQF